MKNMATAPEPTLTRSVDRNTDGRTQDPEVSPRDAVRLVRQTRRIDGWLSPGAIYLFALIDRIQKQEVITGNLFEIGVHHGKSALVLATMARANERLGVCDIFGAQDLNVSVSGKGDRAIFTDNFAKAFPGNTRLDIYEKLSSDLTTDEVTRCRFLHVDGGHSSPEALADLELCAQCLAPGGVIAVDDAFHPTWPGVTDAIFQFLLRRPDMQPLAVGFNKMLLVGAEWRDRYARVFNDPGEVQRYFPRQPYRIKVVEVFGVPTHVLHAHGSRSERTAAEWLYRLTVEHPRLDNAATGALWRGLRRVGRALKMP